MKRVLTAIAIVALTSTGAVALATNRTPTPPKPRPPVSTPMPGCSVKQPAPATRSSTPPSQQLLDSLGVLKRPATPEDRPPESALKYTFFAHGLRVDAARQAAPGTWLLPAENVAPPLAPTSAGCLRNYTPKQRREIRAIERKTRERGPVEGIVLLGETPGGNYPLETIQQGKAFVVNICAGPMHDKIGFRGIVADTVSKVTVAGRDGAMTETTPANNLFTIELARPASANQVPAHLTYATPTGPLDIELPPGNEKAMTHPCEPPSKASLGNRREPPTRLKNGALLELTTSRWQSVDSGPLLAGATTHANGRRCLLIAPEDTLKAGGKAHRFCVADAALKQRAYIARATRLPNGDVILEGFADRAQISYMLLERAIVPGARVLRTATGSGAFFFAVRGPHKGAGTFDLRAARRGAPVRYFNRRIIRLARE